MTSWSLPLVPVAYGRERVLVVPRRQDLGETTGGSGRLGQFRHLGGPQRVPDLGVFVEPPRLVGQDQVGAHAPAREVPHAIDVLGAIWVCVEVPHAVPAGVLEELHHIERITDPLGAEPEVLVELSDPLGVEVDVEELALPQGLRDRL